MYLSRSIVLNNSLLLNYLILGSYSYCDSQIHNYLSSTHYSETNLSRPASLEDFVFLNSKSSNNIEYPIKYKYNKQTNFMYINTE